MALKIAVLKNFPKTSTSSFIVRSDSSEVVEYEKFIEIMAAGRTALSQIEILGAMRLRFEPKDAAQGLFFADASGVESRSSFYPMALPGTVLAAVPEALAAGTLNSAPPAILSFL